jgi:hypothetical protein
MPPNRLLLPLLLLAASGRLAAQGAPAPAVVPALAPDTLPLRDMAAFRAPATGWGVVGTIAADRARERALSGVQGAGVLLDDRGAADLATRMEHGDLDLELEFLTAKGGESGVLLQGRYELQLADSWGVRTPTHADVGGIPPRGPELPGLPPRVNAGRAPGVWQTLSVRFRAPRFDAQGRKLSDARFVRVEQNGVVIHEDVRVPGPTRGAPFQDERALGPLVLQGGRGGVAFRNVRLKRYGGDRVVVSGLRYQAREGAFEGLAQATAGTAARGGTADGISSALAGASDRWALTFDGTIRVPAAGRYVFEMAFDWVDDDPQFKGTVVGGGRLAIDGREVLVHEGRLPSQAAAVELTAGEHALSTSFYKNRPWTNRAGVLLFVEGPGIERQPLHVVRPPDLPGAIAVEPGGAPVVLRGFVYHGDTKRTHAVSVGDPAGVHYSYDLARGALLAAWRGPFVETTEMWHERGNDQVSRPLGSAVSLAGAPALALLADAGAPWPGDTAAVPGLAYRGYALDSLGRPAFLYRLGQLDVEDRVRVADDGASLRRELRLRGPEGGPLVHVQLAAGGTIRKLADGAYLVDDARYYVAPDPGLEPVVREVGARRELVVPARLRAGEARVAYTLIW